MSLNAEFPAEVHLRIENKWLNDYQTVDNAYADCRHLDSTQDKRVMRPRGILIGRNNDGSSTTAVVRGCLWGENHNQVDDYELAIGVTHPLAFKFVYAKGTTGRNIKVFG